LVDATRGKHPSFRELELLSELAEASGGESREAAIEARRKRWVEDRLKQEGLARAVSLGWPNTYSYSKSLGEQLVFAAQDTIAATVARRDPDQAPGASRPTASRCHLTRRGCRLWLPLPPAKRTAGRVLGFRAHRPGLGTLGEVGGSAQVVKWLRNRRAAH
jgi:hypothetical protein